MMTQTEVFTRQLLSLRAHVLGTLGIPGSLEGGVWGTTEDILDKESWSAELRNEPKFILKMRW